MTIQSIAVLGGGSAGLIAALTLKRKIPDLAIKIVRSPEIGIIGVGEGTTASFPRHIFNELRLKIPQFYELAEPTWKLGIKFLWGPQDFFYTFSNEFNHRHPELPRNNGFFYRPETPYAGTVSAFMQHDKVFARRPDGSPFLHGAHAFHVENTKLVRWLESVCRGFGVEIVDATVEAEVDGDRVSALITAEGERIEADLFIDASGFRSELLGKAFDEPFLSYEDSLFCDRAVIGGWERGDEPIKPYTVAETMNAGWCWQIEHEHWINRGYVYSSRFLDDDAARAEFLAKNPRVAGELRLVKFRSGRYRRSWIGNVVGIGNSTGFVEPLEATALQVIIVEASTLADSLIDSLCAPTPSLVELFNQYIARVWDDIRDFLAIHYKFNTRLDTPFWRSCREETALHGAEPLVRFYQENGPSVVAGAQLFHPSNSFGMEGYLAMLIGQGVPHGKPYEPEGKVKRIWEGHLRSWEREAARAMTVEESLQAIRKPGMKWN